MILSYSPLEFFKEMRYTIVPKMGCDKIEFHIYLDNFSKLQDTVTL